MYSLGIVFYELFSRGERPAGLERIQAEGDGPEHDGQNEEELSETVDPLPCSQGDRTIDLDAFSGVDVDDREFSTFDNLLRDKYTDVPLHDQNPRKKTSTSTSNNTFVMRAVSVEPLKARGVPGPLCDLISNMLLDAADGNDKLGMGGKKMCTETCQM